MFVDMEGIHERSDKKVWFNAGTHGKPSRCLQGRGWSLTHGVSQISAVHNRQLIARGREGWGQFQKSRLPIDYIPVHNLACLKENCNAAKVNTWLCLLCSPAEERGGATRKLIPINLEIVLSDNLEKP